MSYQATEAKVSAAFKAVRLDAMKVGDYAVVAEIGHGFSGRVILRVPGGFMLLTHDKSIDGFLAVGGYNDMMVEPVTSGTIEIKLL